MIRRVALALAGAVLAGAAPAWAGAWGDASTVSTGQLGTLQVATPTNFQCNGLGLLYLKFSWDAVPGATGYVLDYGGETVETTDTFAYTLALIGGGTATVRAYRSFGSNRWTSAPSAAKHYAVIVVALCG